MPRMATYTKWKSKLTNKYYIKLPTITDTISERRMRLVANPSDTTTRSQINCCFGNIKEGKEIEVG